MNRTRSRIWAAGKLTGIIVITLAIAACGAGKTTVMKPPTEKFTVASAVIVEQTSTIEVPAKIRKNFQLLLNDKIFEKDGFTKGSELKLTYTFIQYEPGSRAARYLLGGLGNSGEGSMTILVRFEDASGRQIAEIQAEGEIGSGVYGGSINAALNKAAEEIAQYAKSNFRS